MSDAFLPPIDVENVYIFAADSLRFDYLPPSIAALGAPVKTIAASLLSPSSFASMMTGVYPQRHGVYNFRQRVTVPTLLDTPGVNAGFWDESGPDLGNTLGSVEQTPLAEIQPPFVYLEREMVTHLPYNRPNQGAAATYTIQDYLRTMVADLDQLQADYKAGADAAATRFRQRLQTLRTRGLLEKTLVIFTSDHGELLGEYGVIGHNSPACPELVTVPSVFIHPAIAPRPLADGVIGHVDLAPTVLRALSQAPLIPLDGVDLFSHPLPQLRCNAAEGRLYSSQSAWGVGGGRAYFGGSRSQRLAHALSRKRAPDPACMRLTGRRFGIVPLLARAEATFEMPRFDDAAAKAAIAASQAQPSYVAGENEISDDVRQRLHDLGYLDV